MTTKEMIIGTFNKKSKTEVCDFCGLEYPDIQTKKYPFIVGTVHSSHTVCDFCDCKPYRHKSGDKRILRGDDFAADAWTNWRGDKVVLVSMGVVPKKI